MSWSRHHAVACLPGDTRRAAVRRVRLFFLLDIQISFLGPFRALAKWDCFDRGCCEYDRHADQRGDPHCT
jgi:hypothetical protein